MIPLNQYHCNTNDVNHFTVSNVNVFTERSNCLVHFYFSSNFVTCNLIHQTKLFSASDYFEF